MATLQLPHIGNRLLSVRHSLYRTLKYKQTSQQPFTLHEGIGGIRLGGTFKFGFLSTKRLQSRRCWIFPLKYTVFAFESGSQDIEEKCLFMG
jgi:hypothetical protein